MPRQPEPGGAGFIHVAHLRSASGELLVETIHAVRVGWHGAVGTELAGGVGDGHGDGLGVDIQAGILDDVRRGCWVHNGIAVDGFTE